MKIISSERPIFRKVISKKSSFSNALGDNAQDIKNFQSWVNAKKGGNLTIDGQIGKQTRDAYGKYGTEYVSSQTSTSQTAQLSTNQPTAFSVSDIANGAASTVDKAKADADAIAAKAKADALAAIAIANPTDVNAQNAAANAKKQSDLDAAIATNQAKGTQITKKTKILIGAGIGAVLLIVIIIVATKK